MSPRSQQILIYFLLAVILVLCGYIAMNRPSGDPAGGLSERDLRRLERRLADKRGGSDADPYEKNEVKNTILKNAADPIQACYKEWVAKNPQFTFGRISIDWTIDPNGEPQNVEIVASELPEIDSCVIETVTNLKFPPPPAGESRYVHHKFLFKQEGKKEGPADSQAPAQQK